MMSLTLVSPPKTLPSGSLGGASRGRGGQPWHSSKLPVPSSNSTSSEAEIQSLTYWRVSVRRKWRARTWPVGVRRESCRVEAGQGEGSSRSDCLRACRWRCSCRAEWSACCFSVSRAVQVESMDWYSMSCYRIMLWCVSASRGPSSYCSYSDDEAERCSWCQKERPSRSRSRMLLNSRFLITNALKRCPLASTQSAESELAQRARTCSSWKMLQAARAILCPGGF